MANLTQTQIRQLVRASIGEKDFANIKDVLMNQFINYGIRKLQQDFISIGLKIFTRQAYLTGSVVAVPTDLLALPNAVIDFKASTGAKTATALITSASGTVSFMLREPAVTAWTTTWTVGSALSVSVDPVTRIIAIVYISATTTNAQVISALNANVLFAYYFDTATGTNTSQVVVLTGASTNINSNTGNGWLPVEELSIEDFNRDPSNTYLTPTATNIEYKRNGNISGAEFLEFLPNSVTYSWIFYYYRLADLTTDSDASPIPPEHEELLIIDVGIRCYLTLKKTAEAQDSKTYYQKKADDLLADYVRLLEARKADKTRLKQESPND